jgi:hypothetical protein
MATKFKLTEERLNQLKEELLYSRQLEKKKWLSL